jgi:hypothetical protein
MMDGHARRDCPALRFRAAHPGRANARDWHDVSRRAPGRLGRRARAPLRAPTARAQQEGVVAPGKDLAPRRALARRRPFAQAQASRAPQGRNRQLASRGTPGRRHGANRFAPAPRHDPVQHLEPRSPAAHRRAGLQAPLPAVSARPLHQAVDSGRHPARIHTRRGGDPVSRTKGRHRVGLSLAEIQPDAAQERPPGGAREPAHARHCGRLPHSRGGNGDAARIRLRGLRLGGVGYYPKTHFIHADTGKIRTWEGS